MKHVPGHVLKKTLHECSYFFEFILGFNANLLVVDGMLINCVVRVVTLIEVAGSNSTIITILTI